MRVNTAYETCLPLLEKQSYHLNPLADSHVDAFEILISECAHSGALSSMLKELLIDPQEIL